MNKARSSIRFVELVQMSDHWPEAFVDGGGLSLCQIAAVHADGVRMKRNRSTQCERPAQWSGAFAFTDD